MKQQFYILRGVPGSGKSTLAKIIQSASGHPMDHFEADQYFVDADGVYNFNPAYLHHAHRQCEENVYASIAAGRSVVVSNTFTTKKELRAYFMLAADLEIRPLVILCQSRMKSIHDVPDDAMERMRSRFDYTATDTLFDEFFQR